MRKSIFIIVFSMSFALGFAQKITLENEFTTAYKLAKSNNAILLLYFVNGENSSLERTIKKNVLKSNRLKTLNSNVIIVTVNDNIENSYNKRLTVTHNNTKKFPALKALRPSVVKSTKLYTTFSESDVSSFFKNLQSL